MSLPIDTFRIMNQYMSFSDKYKAYSSSDELQHIIMEDLSMSVDDIINLFNDGDMNQIQFAMKHCKQDIELKLHECIPDITNIDSIVFIIREFLTKICSFLNSEMNLNENSDFSILYDTFDMNMSDEDRYEEPGSDTENISDYDGEDANDEDYEQYGISLIYDFIEMTPTDNPSNEYERRLNTLISIIEKINTNPKYYDILHHVPEILSITDYKHIFNDIIKSPERIDTINAILKFDNTYNTDIKLTDENFQYLTQLHDSSFDILFEGYNPIIRRTELKMLIDNFDNIKTSRLNKIIETLNIHVLRGSIDKYIKEIPLPLMITLFDRNLDPEIVPESIAPAQFITYIPTIKTVMDIIDSGDIEKLKVYIAYQRSTHIDGDIKWIYNTNFYDNILSYKDKVTDEIKEIIEYPY